MNSRQHQGGYALIIMLVILVLGSLYSVVSQLSLVQAKAQQGTSTDAALAQAKAALLGYASTYRDNHSTNAFGYLPCPDTDGDGDAEANCGTAGQTVVGLFPYKTLGLPDLRDSAGGCLWYVTSGSFKNNPATTPMNWDTQGQIKIIDTNGNMVIAPDDVNGGAAAVIIASGPAVSAQTRTTDSNSTHLCGIVPSEISAYLDGNYTFPNSGTVILTQGNVGSASNNDQILSITPKEIFSNVKKRSDFQTIMTLLFGDRAAGTGTIAPTIQTQINSDITACGNSTSCSPTTSSQPTNQGNYTQYSGKLVGELPSLSGYSSNNDYLNWKDHYRYAVCSNLKGYCFDVGGSSCAGVLFFGGSSSDGSPRASISRSLADYFEGDRSSVLTSTSNSIGAENKSYASTSPSTDLVSCLAVQPAASLSFTSNYNQFTAANSGTTLAAPTSGTGSLQVGGDTGSTANAGCIWYQPSISFSSGIHAYFRYQITRSGEGFTFVLADANNGNNPGQMCGDEANGNLGYSLTGSGTPILPPKIGLEFDFKRTTDSGGTYTYLHDDPSGSPTRHTAWIYWGSRSDNSDDNTHSAGGGTDPVNPSRNGSNTQTGLRQFNAMGSTGVDIYVHIDITRSYSSASGQGSYTLKAYVATDTTLFSSGCSPTDFQRVDVDLSSANSLCIPANYNSTTPASIISDSITVTDFSSGVQALRQIYPGFTGAQANGTTSTLINIYDFKLQSY